MMILKITMENKINLTITILINDVKYRAKKV